MEILITSTAIFLLFTMLSVAPSPVQNDNRSLSARRLPQESKENFPSHHKIMKRFAKIGHMGMENEDHPVVPSPEKCLSDHCPTKKTGSNFMSDYYDENVDDRAEQIESDYRASVLEGSNGAKSRKTKVFEADYVHLGVLNDRPQAPKKKNCPGCRTINIVISDVSGDNRKVLSDMTYAL